MRCRQREWVKADVELAYCGAECFTIFLTVYAYYYNVFAEFMCTINPTD
jgi:hypothetical protein